MTLRLPCYNAQTIVFKPEAGFAVLGLSKEAGELTTLNTTVNQNALSSPVVNASGHSAWAGGFSAWAGGHSAWAGGFSAWAGGWSAWAGGNTVPALPSGNEALWDQINLHEAHKNAVNFGEGITVAVIDTGIDLNHEIFEGRLAPSSQWKDYIDHDNYPQEEGSSSDADFGHGTAVAGLIAQIAPKAKILPLRVLDKDGRGDLGNVISAIEHAISKADVINLSLGSYDQIWSLENIINYAAQQDVLLVASVGNDGGTSATYPAKFSWRQDTSIFPHMYGVGSVASNNAISSFSNDSADAISYTLGESLVTTYPNNQLTQATGTSFSAPVVAGSLALALSDYQGDPANLFKYAGNTAYWPANFNGKSYGILDANSLLKSAQNKPGYNLMGEGWLNNFTFWDWQTNAAITSNGRSDWRNHGGEITGSGGFGQVVSGLHPNTTYTFSGYLRVDNATDWIGLNVKNHGASQVSLGTNSTGWVLKEVTFTTGPYSTSAEVFIWKNGSSKGFGDDFYVQRK